VLRWLPLIFAVVSVELASTSAGHSRWPHPFGGDAQPCCAHNPYMHKSGTDPLRARSFKNYAARNYLEARTVTCKAEPA
jgi:hypothetical protein